MEDPEAEARAQRQRLEAAEIFAFILPMLDRILVIDARALPEHAPKAWVIASAEIVQDFVIRFRRQLSDTFLRRPELIFSRLRLFAYLDGEMAQLVVESALAQQRRPPVDRSAERTFAYARVRNPAKEFFDTAVWKLVEETVQRKSGGVLGDQLATCREQLCTWEQELQRRAQAEERRRLFSERHYRIIRPQDPEPPS
jgi:hypothetical protein